MFQAFLNIFKVPELRNKILFTLGLLAVYRVGFYVPLPGVDQEELGKVFQPSGGSAPDPLTQLTEAFQMFTGGNLQQSTVFGLGIMPYISASIIFQLLATVVPALEKLQKEGESGRKKIQEWTRYGTVALCLIQGWFWLNYITNPNQKMVYPEYQGSFLFWFVGLTALTAGTIFLMWLGEQIDEYGIGNGISLIIMAGIVARMPQAFMYVWHNTKLSVTASSQSDIGPLKIAFLIAAFIGVIACAILITQAQRRIPIQQAKQMRGRRVFGGQRQYLPLRVNHGGVMPIIFASSLMLFPTLLLGWLARVGDFWGSLYDAFNRGTFLYVICYIALVYFFAYFWTTVQFRPKDMANQLRDYGSFIPGLRPGKRTADYLETVMTRITYVGAGFLAMIAIIPQVVGDALNIDYMVTSFLGGTGLLIAVSVGLDLIQRVEANLIMRNYGGFLDSSGGRIKGPYQ